MWIRRFKRNDLLHGVNRRLGEIRRLVIRVVNVRSHRFSLGIEIGEDADHVIAKAPVGGNLRVCQQPSVAAELRDPRTNHARRRVTHDWHTG
jgi:hypothetical protein